MLLSLAVLVVSVGGFVVVKWFDSSIARVHLSLGQSRPAEAQRGTENWLLVGTDSRAGTDGQYGSVEGQRSDTTILSHLDANGTVTNVSFPRDTLVKIPAYTDSKGDQHPAHKDKFNAAISLGGASLLVRTVEQLTGIRIDHYVSVDLAGFQRMSQVIGGVQVCLLPSSYVETTTEAGITHVSTNINDSYSGFHGKVGEQTVVGSQALAFVRQRHGLVDGDIGRIRRQQQFLGAVFRKATSTAVLANPAKLTSLLSAISSSLTLDQNTSLSDLEQLALRLADTAADKITFETLPQRSLSLSDTDLGEVFTDSAGVLELIPTGQTQSVGSVQILEQPGFYEVIAALKDIPSLPSTATPEPTVPSGSAPPPSSGPTAAPTSPAPTSSDTTPVTAASAGNRCTY